MQPAIILVSAEHAAFLLDEFGRYARDYDLYTAGSCAEANEVTKRVRDAGGQVALFVSDTELPDAHVLEAFHKWRTVIPTARRIIAAHWTYFLERAPALRPGMAKGKYDAYLHRQRRLRGRRHPRQLHEAGRDRHRRGCVRRTARTRLPGAGLTPDLTPVRRVGAGSRDGHRRGPHGVGQDLGRVAPGVVPQGVDDRRAEGVARADGVRHRDAGRRHLHDVVGVQPGRTGAAAGDRDRARAQREQVRRRVDERAAGVERRQVLVAGLDQVRGRHDLLDPGDECGAGPGDRGPGVDVVGDGGPGQSLHDRQDVVGARLEHRPDRADVDEARALVAQRVEPPVQVEHVRRRPVRRDRRLGRGGALDGVGICRQHDVVASQVLGDRAPPRVIGVRRGEPDGPTEPRQGDGHVGGTATRPLGPAPVGLEDDVNQRLTDDQHVGIHGPSLPPRLRYLPRVVDIVLDPSLPEPPFEQVRSQVARRAASGDLPAGTKLPTVRALAAQLGVAVNTVARAYKELEADGVVVTEGRRGTFVAAPDAPADVEAAAADLAATARRAGLTLAQTERLLGSAWVSG